MPSIPGSPGASVSSPTIADVAEAAKVSIAIVSRVLNGHPDVAESTRRKVLLAADQVGYKPVAPRRQRSRSAYPSISIIVHAVDNEYVGVLVQGILDQLDQIDHQAVLHLSAVEPERERRYCRMARLTDSDGVLVITPRSSDRELLDVVGHKLPLVLIDAYPELPSTPCVRSTNWHGAREATNYLIELGHRRIAFIAGRRGDHITEAREHGYRSALIDSGIAFDPALVRDGDYGRISGYRAADELLAMEPRPTAIFACADQMATGAMEAAHVRGLRVPDDLSIIGFDDLPSMMTLHPPITTVRQPLYQMGRMAAQMVSALASGQELVSRQIELPTRLIIRESCARLRS